MDFWINQRTIYKMIHGISKSNYSRIYRNGNPNCRPYWTVYWLLVLDLKVHHNLGSPPFIMPSQKVFEFVVNTAKRYTNKSYLGTKICKFGCLIKSQVWHWRCVLMYVRVTCQNTINIFPYLYYIENYFPWQWYMVYMEPNRMSQAKMSMK